MINSTELSGNIERHGVKVSSTNPQRQVRVYKFSVRDTNAKRRERGSNKARFNHRGKEERAATNYRLPKLGGACSVPPLPSQCSPLGDAGTRGDAEGGDMTTDLILTSRSHPAVGSTPGQVPPPQQPPGPAAGQSKLPTLRKGTTHPPAAGPAPTPTPTQAATLPGGGTAPGEDQLLALGLPRLVHLGASSAVPYTETANKQLKVRMSLIAHLYGIDTGTCLLGYEKKCQYPS
jgi:hypothetical protein